jgi:hypothetical protein
MSKVSARSLGLFLVLTVLSCSSCVSGRGGAFHALSFETSSHPSSIVTLWTKKMPGLITDLAVANGGSAVLVSTAPDQDSDTKSHQYLISLYSSQAKLLWSSPAPYQTKAQSISDDGSLSVVANHNEEITAFDSAGKKIWTAEGMCKPMVLSRLKRVLCYHDDDAEPEVAFDVYNWQGKKLLSLPITNDILSLKVATDESGIALGLNRGQVMLVDEKFHSVWQKKVSGEILDVAVSSGPESRVSVLYASSKHQAVAVFDRAGNLKGELTPSFHAEQIEALPDGSAAFIYGNGAGGQSLAMFPLTLDDGKKPKSLKESWVRREPRYADYSSSMIVTKDTAVIGLEDVVTPAKGRHSHLLGFDLEGNVRWNLPLVTEEGAYLYGQAFGQTGFLAVGTDDAFLGAYQVN